MRIAIWVFLAITSCTDKSNKSQEKVAKCEFKNTFHGNMMLLSILDTVPSGILISSKQHYEEYLFDSASRLVQGKKGWVKSYCYSTDKYIYKGDSVFYYNESDTKFSCIIVKEIKNCQVDEFWIEANKKPQIVESSFYDEQGRVWKVCRFVSAKDSCFLKNTVHIEYINNTVKFKSIRDTYGNNTEFFYTDLRLDSIVGHRGNKRVMKWWCNKGKANKIYDYTSQDTLFVRYISG